MFKRDTAKFMEVQNNRINDLIVEGISGVTKMDTLSDRALPLQGEAEAMYFKSLRNFFGNTISKRVMTASQDVFEGI